MFNQFKNFFFSYTEESVLDDIPLAGGEVNEGHSLVTEPLDLLELLTTP